MLVSRVGDEVTNPLGRLSPITRLCKTSPSIVLLVVLIGYYWTGGRVHALVTAVFSASVVITFQYRIYSQARVQVASSAKPDCQTLVGHATQSLGITLFITIDHPLGFSINLSSSSSVSSPRLHFHQPHSSHHINLNTTTTHNKQINKPTNLHSQHTANMQLTNYALTLLLPAYLAAAQGGAESVGQDIGQGLGAVSGSPPRP